MADLRGLGILEGVIYEAVATVRAGGSVHHAPLGFRLEGGVIKLRIYRDSKAFEHFRQAEDFVLNIVRDPAVFFASAFKGRSRAELEFEPSKCVSSPRLKVAEGFIECEVVERRYAEDFVEVISKPLCYESRPALRPYSRAESMLIEAMVWATKAKAFAERGWADRAREAAARAATALEVVSRTSSNEIHLGIASAIKEEVARWLARS